MARNDLVYNRAYKLQQFICVEPGNILHYPSGTPCMRALSHQGTKKNKKKTIRLGETQFTFY